MKKNLLDSIALIVLFALVVIWAMPLLENITFLAGETDWLQLASVHHLLRESLLKYGQFPLRTPFFGGGYPIFSHPQCDILNPLFLLTIFFREWVSLKLRVVLYLLIGAGGMFLLTRRGLRYSRTGSLFSAGLLVFNSYYPFHIATGNPDVGLYLYLPLLLFFLLRSREKPGYLYPLILLWAHLLLGANGLFLPVMALFLLLYCLASPLEGGGFRRAAGLSVNLFLGLLGGSIIAAVRVIPLIELLQRAGPRFSDYLDAQVGSVSPLTFYHSLFSSGPFRDLAPLHQDVFPNGRFADSTMFFGVIPLVLGLAAVIIHWRQVRVWLVLLPVFALLMMGSQGPIDLFHYLWHLPVFHSIHLPNKYFAFPVAFIIALLPGRLFPLRLGNRRNRIRMMALSAAGLLALFQMFNTSRLYLGGLFSYPAPPSFAERKPFFQVLEFTRVALTSPGETLPVYRPGMIFYPSTNSLYLDLDQGEGSDRIPVNVTRYNASQYFFILQGIGVIPWYGWLYLPEFSSPKYLIELATGESYLHPSYRGEYYFLQTENQVSLLEFSPQRLKFELSVKRPDILVINQNYDRYWRSSRGEVVEVDGLLALRLTESGEYEVSLVYLPSWLYLGLAISTLSITVLTALIWRRRRRR